MLKRQSEIQKNKSNETSGSNYFIRLFSIYKYSSDLQFISQATNSLDLSSSQSDMEKHGEWWRDWETPHKPNREREEGGGAGVTAASLNQQKVCHSIIRVDVIQSSAVVQRGNDGNLEDSVQWTWKRKVVDGGRLKNKWIIQGFFCKRFDMEVLLDCW